MEHGKKIERDCSNCSQKKSIHINNVYAKPDKTLLLISSLILLLGTAIILYYVRDSILNYEISGGTYIMVSTLLIPFFFITY